MVRMQRSVQNQLFGRESLLCCDTVLDLQAIPANLCSCFFCPQANSRKISPNIRVLVTSQGDGQGASGGYTAGPGPQRGGNYNAPTQTQSFHPYRRM